MKLRIVSGAALLALCLLPASGAVIIDQSSGQGPGYISQVFGDEPTGTSYEFDDFTTSQSWALGSLTVFGTETGYPIANQAVTAEIWTGLPGTGSLLMSSVSGALAGANLDLDFGGQVLAPGTYWLTAYVTRPFATGGQWYWNSRTPVDGSESYFYNPGGYFGYGTAPIAGSLSIHSGTAVDMAFTLNGTAQGTLGDVPEPATFGLVLAGAGLIAAARRKR